MVARPGDGVKAGGQVDDLRSLDQRPANRQRAPSASLGLNRRRACTPRHVASPARRLRSPGLSPRIGYYPPLPDQDATHMLTATREADRMKRGWLVWLAVLLSGMTTAASASASG